MDLPPSYHERERAKLSRQARLITHHLEILTILAAESKRRSAAKVKVTRLDQIHNHMIWCVQPVAKNFLQTLQNLKLVETPVRSPPMDDGQQAITANTIH